MAEVPGGDALLTTLPTPDDHDVGDRVLREVAQSDSDPTVRRIARERLSLLGESD